MIEDTITLCMMQYLPDFLENIIPTKNFLST